MSPVAAARPVPASDTQWWQEIDATTSPATDWRMTVSGFSRFGDALPNPALVGGAVGAAYASGRWTYGTGVIYAALRSPAKGARMEAELPYAAVTATILAGGCAFTDRLRVEDVVGVKGDPWRYRNQVGISRQLRRGSGSPYLFATDEVFMGVNPQRFARNRLLAGLGVPLTGRATVELAYLNQDNAGQRPGRIQGLSMTLKVGF